MENDFVIDDIYLSDVDIHIEDLDIVETVKVDVVNTSTNLPLPEYKTPGSAGMDLYADISEPYILDPGEIKVMPTNIRVKLPKDYELQVRARSGLAAKHGITVLNSPGTVDSDYTDKIGVILINLGGGPYKINPGDRIAQAVVARYSVVNWNEVTELPETERKGGFGSTGI